MCFITFPGNPHQDRFGMFKGFMTSLQVLKPSSMFDKLIALQSPEELYPIKPLSLFDHKNLIKLKNLAHIAL